MILKDVRQEKTKIEVVVQDLEDKMRDANPKRVDENGRAELIQSNIVLDSEITGLKVTLANYKNGDPTEMEYKRNEAIVLKSVAETRTDHILILEVHLKTIMGGDIESHVHMKREVYGTELIEGEGLKKPYM